MLRPRWRKVLRDLWSNKTRTLLVVLSIAVGVAG
jgi:putative ABC transport system permease protein